MIRYNLTMTLSALNRSTTTPCRQLPFTHSLSKHRLQQLTPNPSKPRPSNERLHRTSFSTNNLKLAARRDSFVSIYSNKSRLQNVMALKPPSSISSGGKRSQNLTFSLSSSHSEFKTRKRKPLVDTRFDRIMNINVIKPEVTSTMKNYQPFKAPKPHPLKRIKKQDSEVYLRKECKQKLRRAQRQEEEENKLWKSFEREREIRIKEDQKVAERVEKREREVEKRLERMVEKELRKIETESELEKRKERAFSPYIYPMF